MLRYYVYQGRIFVHETGNPFSFPLLVSQFHLKCDSCQYRTWNAHFKTIQSNSKPIFRSHQCVISIKYTSSNNTNWDILPDKDLFVCYLHFILSLNKNIAEQLSSRRKEKAQLGRKRKRKWQHSGKTNDLLYRTKVFLCLIHVYTNFPDGKTIQVEKK